uniref:Uncharacterized protein n=1 Tax=Arundo donax TaxID=35708 RepID=A0A0A9GEG4_ARUDO
MFIGQRRNHLIRTCQNILHSFTLPPTIQILALMDFVILALVSHRHLQQDLKKQKVASNLRLINYYVNLSHSEATPVFLKSKKIAPRHTMSACMNNL